MCVLAEDNLGWTIADELKYVGDHVDGVYFNQIVIYHPNAMTKSVYTMENGDLDLGVLLQEFFGDAYIKVVDVGTKRIFELDF